MKPSIYSLTRQDSIDWGSVPKRNSVQHATRGMVIANAFSPSLEMTNLIQRFDLSS